VQEESWGSQCPKTGRSAIEEEEEEEIQETENVIHTTFGE
jgi:hypothetical protein